jgi:acetylornithine/succinyldiaminopimelate/putrescine aminotransferase
VQREKLVERAAELGARLGARLAGFAAERPDLAREARGRGLLQALVLADAEEAAALPRRALARGVLANVTAGRVLRLFPALNVPEDDLWRAVEALLALIAEAPGQS